jgi:hypothetical protein
MVRGPVMAEAFTELAGKVIDLGRWSPDESVRAPDSAADSGEVALL